MLKPVKPRGDTSVAFLDWAKHQGAGKHLPRNSPVRPEICSIRATALESYALFRCVQSVVLVLSMPLYRQWLIYQIATLLLVTGFVRLFCLLLV